MEKYKWLQTVSLELFQEQYPISMYAINVVVWKCLNIWFVMTQYNTVK